MDENQQKLIISDEFLMQKIYMIRGIKVMLDRDLAFLYGVKPIRLREQVKRNKERFPGNFMFQLSDNEIQLMVSQNAIPSKQHLGGSQPYVFTEHGILMLANILKSQKAIHTSIRIINIFVKMREMLLTNKDILLKLEKLETKVGKHDEKINLIFEYIKKMLVPDEQKKRNRIGYL